MKLPQLPPWTWRNIVALIALLATIAGAAVLTGVAWWLLTVFGDDADRLITELVRDRNARPEVGQVLIIVYEAMAWGLKLLLAGVIIVLLSLGLAITSRKFEAEGLGFKSKFSGGDDDPAPVAAAAAAAVAVAGAGAAVEKAEEIKEASQ